VDAVRIYVANLMGEPGETDGYSLEDHLAAIREHVGFDLFDYVLINRRPISPSIAAKYARQGSSPIPPSRGGSLGSQTGLIARDLWEVSDGKLRHDPRELSSAILELTRAGRPAANPDGTAGSNAIGQSVFVSTGV